MAKTKKNIQTEKKRKSYTLDDKAKAKKYYLIGLSILEIGKMIDAPFRTVEKWYIAENWKSQRETTPIKTKANDLFCSGLNYEQIAKALNKSKSTISRYLKEVRNGQN